MNPTIALTLTGLISFKRTPARLQEAAFIYIVGYSTLSLAKLAWDLIPENKIDEAIAPTA